jgi:hypothetical protein
MKPAEPDSLVATNTEYPDSEAATARSMKWLSKNQSSVIKNNNFFGIGILTTKIQLQKNRGPQPRNSL